MLIQCNPNCKPLALWNFTPVHLVRKPAMVADVAGLIHSDKLAKPAGRMWSQPEPSVIVANQRICMLAARPSCYEATDECNEKERFHRRSGETGHDTPRLYTTSTQAAIRVGPQSSRHVPVGPRERASEH